MPFRLPDALLNADDAGALRLLSAYFGDPLFGPNAYDGAFFDRWDSLGSREGDTDRFTADDLVAVTLLSVNVSASAARELLLDRRDEFTTLLAAIGPDRDLADEPDELVDSWDGWRLMSALRSLDDVGPTTASKLLARKRPRLRPIYDSVVSELTGTVATQWEPVRRALREDDSALQRRLLRLREQSGLPDEVTALRVLDVIAWMEGKAKGLGSRRK